MSADAIVTGGEDAIRALQQATKTIPIVALADDMLGNGFVNSLSRPNGNTTGGSILAVGLYAARILKGEEPGSLNWSRLSVQKFRVDKWSLSRG